MAWRLRLVVKKYFDQIDIFYRFTTRYLASYSRDE